MWWLLLLAWQGAAWREVAADAVDGEVLTAVRATMEQQREPTPSMAAVARCLSEDQAIQCLERRANRYREALVSEQQVFESRALHPPETQAAMKEAQDLFISLLPSGPEDKGQDGEDSILNLNGRGHKLKKKIHKIIKIIKIIIFIVVVKLKMVFLMLMMQTLFQFKLVAITFMILLIKKYYLWVEWKHKKEEKKAVVYYEHAQHQHHYDESDHFHDGLGGLLGHGAGHEYHKGVEPTAGAEAGGGWGGWWGKRSAEYPTPIVHSGGVPAPGGVPNAAHHLAYSAHVQQPLVG